VFQDGSFKTISSTSWKWEAYLDLKNQEEEWSDQLGCSEPKRPTRDSSVQDDAPYCVPQSDISGMDGQAWNQKGGARKGPT